MTRGIHRTACLVIVASVILNASCGPEVTRPTSLAWMERAKVEAVRVAPGALERKARIVTELAEPSLPRWAGHYAWNNSGEDPDCSASEEVWIAPRNGIAWCQGELSGRDWNHGDVVVDGVDHVVVRWASDPVLTNVPDVSDSRFTTRFNLSDHIDFVPWADQLLIVPRVRMFDVVNSINGGFAGEYSTRKVPALDTPAYEVVARSFAGAMQLPAESATLLRAAPLSVVIDDVDIDSEPDLLRPKPAGEWSFETCIARVPIGSADGVFRGMAFYADTRFFPTGYAFEVREHRSWIRFTIERGGDSTQYALPDEGETLTTRAP